MDNKIVNNIKSLGIDMINKAGSGHPGIVLSAASIIYTLYAKHMNVNIDDPLWENRDRFVLSAGHGSALLYATLYMAGFLSLDDLKQFRHIDSKTPGHPEYGVTNGVDMSTGPLGQGIASAVGMAIAGKKLNKTYKSLKEQSLFDYNVYVLCGDGDLMEGISYEATSLAGSLKLNNLIVLYDSNDISLDGKTKGVFDDNIIDRFKALNWNTILVKDNTVSNIDKAIKKAKKSDRPTLIQIKTILGDGSINENTNKVHGSPLDKDDIAKLKLKLKINPEEFYVDLSMKEHFSKQISERSLKKYNLFKQLSKDLNYNKEEHKIDLSDLNFDSNLKESLRVTNGKIMKEIEKQLPNFIGGSADLASSTKTIINNNINFGVREHAMGAILNGLALSNFYAFGSTFLVFSDYLKPSMRLSCLMNLPVTYIFTHDSINIGQDGPTHQPIEQLISLRSIPNMFVFRPADAKEIVGSWEYIINNKKPSCLVLSRNEVSLNKLTNAKSVMYGGYIVRKENNLYATIISTGSEVELSIKIADYLYENYKLDIRVVSMPSRELFLSQSKEYQESIIPKGYRNIVIEAGSKYGWEGFVYSDKYLITLDRFGCSGTSDEVLNEMDFSYDKILQKIIKLLK
ncbi:MAG TPA: transketolase [Candidatus Faecisoma merdavium]|nr:transketolase [Candidatus Faecisoma merdavium]